MNTCVLIAEVITNPELRKTQNDADVANMTVEFPGLREEDPTARIRVVGWGNIGLEMSEKYRVGDRLVIEGSLRMNLVEMNGYKEKKAELRASRIYAIAQAGGSSLTQPAAISSNVVDFQPAASEPMSAAPSNLENTAPAAVAPTSTEEEFDEGTLDEIPF